MAVLNDVAKDNVNGLTRLPQPGLSSSWANRSYWIVYLPSAFEISISSV